MKLKEVKGRVTLREKMPVSFSDSGVDFLEVSNQISYPRAF